MYKTHTLTVTGTVQLVLSIIYGLDNQDIMIHFWYRQEIYFFSKASRLALWPHSLLFNRQGSLSIGVKWSRCEAD